VELREDLISLVCLVLNAIALVMCRMLETWIPLNVGWLGIYSPNHQNVVVGSLLSHGSPDSPVRHRTLSGAPATSAGRWGLTVGALTCGASGLSGGAPDISCRLSGAPTACALTSAHRRALNALQSTVVLEVVVAPLAHRTVR
jgi:hypothetical protein